MSKPSLLYISNFHDGTGWSHAATDYVKCLEPYFDIVCRSIKLNNHNTLCDPYLNKFLNKNDEQYYDFCIQHVLPHMFSKCENANKSILLFANETTLGLPLNWSIYLDMADIVLTISKSMANILNKQQLTQKHIYGVPQPVNLSYYLQNEYKVDTRIRKNNNLIFYTIAEHNNRKNIAAFIKAFHSEFGPEDNVNILIKSNDGANISDTCEQIKKQLNFRQHYINEFIIQGYVSEKDILNLHYTCDVFVSSSSGEAWCMPAIDAMGVGRHIIVPNSTGFKDYVDVDDSIGVITAPCFGMSPYDVNCSWAIIQSDDLRKQMRKLYNSYLKKTPIKNNYIDTLEQFSYDNVGQAISNILLENSAL
jgi:glycosyltransferase involved in cell wall biosynthesis